MLLALATTASALPGDPPSEPLEPADGATVPVDPDGIPVRFTCPVYRTYDDGQGFVLYGGASDHGVSFSRSPAVGPDGRIAEGRAELWVGSCAGNTAYAARRAD